MARTAQETFHEVRADGAGIGAREAAVDDGRGEGGRGDSKALAFGVGDLSDQLFALRREGGAVAEADDEQALGGDHAGPGSEQHRLAEIAAEEAVGSNLREHAAELLVHLRKGREQLVFGIGLEEADDLEVAGGFGGALH